MLALWSGLAAGALHAVSGPDHVAALGPVSVHQGSAVAGARTGAAWGMGHGVGLAALVLLVLGARLSLPLTTLSDFGELLVGLLLVVMGVSAWRKLGAAPHLHGLGQNEHSVFAMGTLHGATGAGHVLGVLPGLGLSGADATLYLVAYGVSAALSMSFVGRLFGELSQRARPATRALLRRACAGASIAVGLLWSLRTLGSLA